MTPTLVPSTATPTTSTPSSSYPSPSTVFIITTVAGSSTSTGYSGDGDAATAAGLYGPLGAAIDSAGEQLLILQSTITSLTN